MVRQVDQCFIMYSQIEHYALRDYYGFAKEKMYSCLSVSTAV